MLSLKTLQLGQSTVKLKRAKDPTDIIWPNRQNSPKKRKYCCLPSLFLLALPGMFWFWNLLLYFIAQIIYSNYDRNAPGVNCDKVIDRWGDNLPNMAYVEKRYAELSGFRDVGSWYLFMN